MTIPGIGRIWEDRVARHLPGEIDSLLACRAGGRLLVGRERIALLEAVMEHKSITKAAEITGFSYKTAWDAVNAIDETANEAIRFLASCPFGRERFPAMICLVRNIVTNEPQGIHRT